MKFSYIQLITRNTGARRKMSPNLPSVARLDILTFLYFQLEMAFTKTSFRSLVQYLRRALKTLSHPSYQWLCATTNYLNA